MSSRALALLLAVGTVWGASFLFIRVAVDEVQPLQIVFMRTFFGAVVMLLFVRARRVPIRVYTAALGQGAVLAVVAVLLPFFLISWAECEIDSGTAAVLNAAVPLFTLLFAVILMEEEELTLARLVGVALGFAGVVLLIGGDIDDSAGVIAMAAVVLSSASYGIAAVGARFLMKRVPPLLLSTTMVTCTCLYGGAILFTTGDPRWHISTEAWLSMIVLGTAGTGGAYIGFYTLIDWVSSVRASFVAYIIPVVGVVLGAAVLGEDLSWFTLAGGLVILLGVAIGTGTTARFLKSQRLETR